MVVTTTDEILFSPFAQRKGVRQIATTYDWAECPDHFKSYRPGRLHCYDADVQNVALDRFGRHLTGAPQD